VSRHTCVEQYQSLRRYAKGLAGWVGVQKKELIEIPSRLQVAGLACQVLLVHLFDEEAPECFI